MTSALALDQGASAVVSSYIGLLKPDPMLYDDVNGGVRFEYDFGFYAGSGARYCLPGGAVSQGAAVTDISGRANGTIGAAGSSLPSMIGNGLDTTGAAASSGDQGVIGPADTYANISAGNQYFLAVQYLLMPASANMPTSGFNPVFANSDGGYNAVPDPLTIGFYYASSTPYIQAYRQTAVGATSMLQTSGLANFFGQLTQIAYWRNAAGVNFRLKSALGVNLQTGSVGSANTANFAACTPIFGLPKAYNNGFNKMRTYRGWMEDLQISGRDPAAAVYNVMPATGLLVPVGTAGSSAMSLLDADWARVAARSGVATGAGQGFS